MAEIALAATGIVLSPFFQVFFERMASHEFDDFFQRRKVDKRLLRKLKVALMSVNAVLEDAEDRQFTETSVKEWLDELKDTVYDAEDILDEIATKHSRHKLDSEFGTIASKVRHSISTPLSDVNKIEGKVKDVVDRLEDLSKLIGVLGLRASVGGKSLERLPTTSLIEESNICGRDCDKEEIIKKVLSNNASGNEIGVIAIVGMGGIGKTTLAQLVYNDNKVKEHFYYKVWVCVSDPFNVLVVTKTILEAVNHTPPPSDIKDQDQVSVKLNEALRGNKFLLVLDDVWDKTHDKWEALSNALKSGAQGSKIIITSRDVEVAKVFEVAKVRHFYADATYPIKELSKEDSWSLFTKYAFDSNFDAFSELEAVGKQIVAKCKGLPLAIKAIGALLWSKSDVNEWNKVLRSELWDLTIEEIGIIPALGLNYKYLPSHLKRCFAYCSIFPKDYAFEKDKLILLWMAEGLLLQPKNKTMEEVGDDYFLTLVSRSLFQQSNRNEYIMHDLVSDLAKFISKQFALSLVDDCPPEIVSNTRHLSFHENFASFHFQEAKRLRTALELNLQRYDIYWGTQFPILTTRCLRVLILSYHTRTKLPNSIGKLIHLRYLDFSHTSIKRLPDSICKLFNLQTLNLSNCWKLTALPRDMHKLTNLRHLDITNTSRMKEMPRHLGKLKKLQTLPKFIIGKHSGSGIGELKKLANLRWRGSLFIMNLQNVTSPTDADLKLVDQKYLEEMDLRWNRRKDSTEDTSERDVVVLKSLQPHSNLKSLAIKGYGGKSFPDWVGHPSFSNLSSLRLFSCLECCSSLPLGQLPSLEKLDIYLCPQVESFTEGGLPSNLNRITIFRCDKLFANRMGWGLQKLQCLTYLSISDEANVVESFPDEGLLPTSLTHLDIQGFQKLKSLDKKGLQHLTTLEELEIYGCPNFKCMPEDGLPASLSTLSIYECPLLEKEWKRKGEEWRKIAHVPHKYLNFNEIE